MYTIGDLRYIPSEPAQLVTGVKGNKRPKNAFKGDKGTFLTAVGPQALLELIDEDKNRFRVDITKELRDIVNHDGKKLCKGRADKICKQAKGTQIKDTSVRSTLEKAWNEVK